jgi:hypothetical protein
VDEPGDAQHAIRPDDDAGNSHQDGRKYALWGNLMAGGAGNEYYFGYGHAESDLTLQDFRSRDQWWDYCRYALEFFHNHFVPFWEMTNRDDLVENPEHTNSMYCFAKAGEVYLVFRPGPASVNLDLTGDSGSYTVKWFNPRTGGELVEGSVKSVKGGAKINLGAPPSDGDVDWLIVLR